MSEATAVESVVSAPITEVQDNAAPASAPKAKRVRKPKTAPVSNPAPVESALASDDSKGATAAPTSEPATTEATTAVTSGKKGKKMSATATKKAPKAPKAAKKGAKKAAAHKSNGAPRAKKEGLRKPQIRILAALNKHGELTRNKISEKAPVDLAALTEYIGSDDAAIRKANDAKHFPSLLGLGFVSAASYPDKDGHDGPTEYKITASGKKALADAQKE